MPFIKRPFFFSLIFLYALVFYSNSVFAQEENTSFYTKFATGVAINENQEVKDGFAIQSGFGWQFYERFRTEFSIDYAFLKLRTTPLSTIRTDLPSWSMMATGYIDLFRVSSFSPYVGAGFGVAKNHAKDLEVEGVAVPSDKDFRLAYQYIGGVAMALPKNLMLDLSYSYMDLGRYSAEQKGVFDYDLKIRKVMLGLRYHF